MGANNANKIEYNIYTFELPVEGKNSQRNKWKKHLSLDDQDAALKEAKKLGETMKFQKIEVKKKILDKKNNKTMDMTIKVISSNEKRIFGTKTIISAVILLGIVVFAVTYSSF